MTARSLLYSSHHPKQCVKHSGNCLVLPKMCRVSKLDNELPSLLSCGLELMVLPSSSFRQPLPSPTKLLYRLDVTWLCRFSLLATSRFFHYSTVSSSGKCTPGSRSYSHRVDTWADSACIHQHVLMPRSKAACII